MAKNESTTSLTQGLYERLRSQVLQGQFQPGERLTISELCTALEGNLSAVREALARLSAEGLVLSEPRRGYRVAPITAEGLLSLTEARLRIEAMCVELAIERGDVAWEAEIAAALHGLLRTPRGEGDAPTLDWSAVHGRFHRALVAGCNNAWLLQIREGLAVQAERYRWFSMKASGRKRDLDREHREIANAFLAHDVAEAKRLMQNHIQRTTDVLLESGIGGERLAHGTAGYIPA